MSNQVEKISRTSMYVALCKKLGTSKQVIIRREIADMSDMVKRQVLQNNELSAVCGSHREGFRLENSDMDLMYWLDNHKVVWDISQVMRNNKTYIVTDSSDSPPGYTLLKLLTPTTDKIVKSASVRENFISSSQYRRLKRQFTLPECIEHGPCSSGNRDGVEFDHAYCFSSDFWPPSVSSWINRSHTWPEPPVVDDIVRNGCHFVAIGNPVGQHEDEEWRISFALAEYKLVKSMSHCQFLLYGLLKIFLNEIIHPQSDKTSNLLCSYHMKTIVFWFVQQNAIPSLRSKNLLTGFWVCFKRLLKCVYEGVCPNFFIPQNNLFSSKVHGSAQRSLFRQLYKLYEKGFSCLLQSNSLKSDITNGYYSPRTGICTNTFKWKLISELRYDKEHVQEMKKNQLLFSDMKDLHHCIKSLQTLELLIVTPLSQCQVAMLQKHTTTILQSTALILHNTYTFEKTKTKLRYKADKISRFMLKLAAEFADISDMVYIALYFYKTLRYNETLSIVKMTKIKLEEGYVMYCRNDHDVDEDEYKRVVGGQCLSSKMRNAVAEDIRICNTIFLFKELEKEQSIAHQEMVFELSIPLFVVLHFLEFLCYRHLDSTKAQTALDDLEKHVQSDQGRYVHNCFKDISWEILGICQQMTGDLQAALYSYRQSHKQKPRNRIKLAALDRINEIYKTKWFIDQHFAEGNCFHCI